MSLVSKLHTGLLNLHNDIIFEICNNIDAQNKQIESDKIHGVQLDTVEKNEKVIENKQIESEKIHGVQLDTVEKNDEVKKILERLESLESKIANIIGKIDNGCACYHGYAPFICDKPNDKIKQILENRQIESDKLHMEGCDLLEILSVKYPFSTP